MKEEYVLFAERPATGILVPDPLSLMHPFITATEKLDLKTFEMYQKKR